MQRISQAIDRLPEAEAKYIAAFAFLLGRVANADLDISSEEVAEMERIVERIGGLSEEQAALVVQIAKAQHKLFGATENFVVTQEFNRVA
ncbi:MAG: TerB family tellurite resistance protein, partial [Bryobacterales bacterium]|nr:TerB family tellurite resistance protein [Bryobacterales bacterium]